MTVAAIHFTDEDYLMKHTIWAPLPGISIHLRPVYFRLVDPSQTVQPVPLILTLRTSFSSPSTTGFDHENDLELSNVNVSK